MNKEYYSNMLFLRSVLPVLKTVVEGKKSLKKAWTGKSGICQIRCLTEEGHDGTHFIINNGEWTVEKGLSEKKADVELVFTNRSHLNQFFKGKQLPFPVMKGVFAKGGIFLLFMKTLITMGGILASKAPPKEEEDQKVLVKCMFNLLSNGISTLNKLKHPEVHPWVKKSPDRVYAWRVDDHEDLSAYIRLKAGNSRAARGIYKRSMPFFTMRFDCVQSALGILLDTDDMLASTMKGKLIMEGGPEYGAQLGDKMLLIGSLIQ